MVGQAGDPPRAHRAGTPRTERASRAPPPHPQGRDGAAAQGQPETTAASLRPLPAQLQQRATPRGPGTATAGPALHPLAPALSHTQQLAVLQDRGHHAPGAPQRRDQVEGRAALREPVPQQRALGLVQQDERTWSMQFGPLLIGVLDDLARRIDKTPVHVLPMSPV